MSGVYNYLMNYLQNNKVNYLAENIRAVNPCYDTAFKRLNASDFITYDNNNNNISTNASIILINAYHGYNKSSYELITATPNRYVNKVIYSIRPIVWTDVVLIDDTDTVTLKIDFYDDEQLFYTQQHVHKMVQQNPNTSYNYGTLNLNHYVAKIVVTLECTKICESLNIVYSTQTNIKIALGEILLL